MTLSWHDPLHRRDPALRALLIAIPLTSAALAPAEAAACFPDACSYAETWTDLTPLNAAAIPVDGVLLLQGARPTIPVEAAAEEDLLATVTLEVTRDGEPVTGTLEATEVARVLAWRPAAPLVPGATYQMTGTLTNPAGYEHCAPELVPLAFDFQADVGPAAPLVAPTVLAEETVTLQPALGLDDLACCDGAMPSEHSNDCGGPAGIDWDEGACTAIRGRGYLSVELTLQTDLPPATAMLVSRTLQKSGRPQRPGFDDVLKAGEYGPFCTQITLRNLATGESVTSDENCHGDAVADQLGPQDIDPVLALADQCSGPVYTCEPDYLSMFETKWDDAACQPWAEQDEGCGCTSQTPDRSYALALLVLGLSRLRRRRRHA